MVNAAVEAEMTALHYASYANDPEMMQLLHAAGAKLEVSDEDGFTPLLCCVSSDSGDAAAALLRLGAQLTCPSGMTGDGPSKSQMPVLGWCALLDAKRVACAL